MCVCVIFTSYIVRIIILSSTRTEMPRVSGDINAAGPTCRSCNRRSRQRQNDAASGLPPTHATAMISSLINSDLYIIIIKNILHFDNLYSAALTGTAVVCIYYAIIVFAVVVVCAEFVFGNVAAGRVVCSVRPTLQR